MLNEAIGERLDWFNESDYQVSDTILEVHEPRAEGQMTVLCRLSGRSVLFKIDRKSLPLLKEPKTVEAIVFHKAATKDWSLHLLECKRTISAKIWRDIKEKFGKSLLNAMALQGILELPAPSAITCHVACYRDKLSVEESTTPVLSKATIQPRTRALREETLEIIEWHRGYVDLFSLKDVPRNTIRVSEEERTATVQL